ncbi:MAG TPA: glycosyltransferase family 39 protein [Candidatus Limnocylindria bacterium]|nr:glycosyltransferase family 39 protein [Candidatus Limnocylindria bacterium]
MTASTSSRYEILIHVSLLLGLCAILYFPYLGTIPLFDKGEPREAVAVQDIVQRGEWLVPLKRATDIPSKPPLFHWSAAFVSKMTGSLSEATVRFPSALYAMLGVLTIYFLGRMIFDPATALLGGAILATMMIYQDQAMSARVDMTLCFFVTLNLTLFYFLYRGVLVHSLWRYLFFALVGIGTLAKGPLGLLLPALVAGSFALWRGRWDVVRKFVFHPGVILALALASGWYVVAVTRGGEGFFDRQILQENLSRFIGGSGHSHPVQYYVPYLFSQSMPWGLFLPVLLWDLFRNGFRLNEGALFLKLWFLVMFAFFSISVGKRPVYLLPIYPALSLLLAAWFYNAKELFGARLAIYRGIAVFAGFSGGLLLTIALGALWSHEPGWFFSLIEGMLKPKDQANLAAVRHQLDDFGWTFTLVALAASALWLALARTLWLGRMSSVAHQLVLLAVLHGFITWSVVMPVIAEGKSYRKFMSEVNRRVKTDDKLYLYGPFNSDPVLFYRGVVIDFLDQRVEDVAAKIGHGDGYLILPEQSWKAIQNIATNLPPPLAASKGKGPEGDAPLVLVRADVP